ncbi:MAG TPA: YCF48-related protein, partial [Nitrosomonas sp.]|nr:YCF48-related protein [Nitrosomonas sp.]
MKRSIICNLITLSCVFFPLILQAQSGWQNAYRIYGCNSIFFADSLTGWYCGYSNKAAGTICMTTDGGRTFQEKYSNPDIDLYKLFFVKQTGYCCGTSGTILKSINGGESWTSMQSNTTVNLYSIFFVDSLYGWACGNNTIVRTTDGGATWIAQVFPNANASLTDIAFSTSQRGYCVDYHAWIGMNKNYQTTDGGLTWSEIAVPFVDGSTIQLLKPSTVIIGGINGIVVSTDGGVTWNLKWNLGTQYCLINDIAFVDNKLGWAVGDGNVVLQTKDGGQNWEPQFLDARVGGPRALSCADSLHAWFVFYDGIYRTINGGKYQLTSPALLAPANYGTEQSINAVFSWSSIEHTTLYHFQLGNDSLFHSLLIDDSTLGSVSKSVSGLLTNTKYYWRVRAANSNGISEWSEIWQFMTTIGIPFHRSPVDKAND